LLAIAGLFAAPSIKVSPSALAFTYVEGSNVLPAPQTLSISTIAGGAATTVYVGSARSEWMTYSPSFGKTTLSVRVALNPTGLPIGQHLESVVLTTPETEGDPVTIPVSLIVKAPPADLKVSPTAISVVHRLGELPPAPVTVNLNTTGGLLPYSVSTSTKWLKVTPSGGAIFPGFRTSLTIGIDPGELGPGNQKGTVTINSPDAITKTTTISVNLAVQPGHPVANSLWPPRINVGASDTTVTISGERFFSGTTVRSGNTVLKSTYLGPFAINAVIPSGLLAAPGNVPITVSNPDPGGGTASPVNFEVQPPGPLLLSIVNAASQQQQSFAPGTVLTIYGSGLGPDILESYDGSTPYLPTFLGGTRVYLNGGVMPLIYSSARQVSFALPNDLPTNGAYMIEVVYGPFRSSTYPLLSAPASPALFTATGSGTGNAAAFQVNPDTGDISMNSDKSPAASGSILILYATGIAPILPVPPTGFVAVEASQNSIRGITVQVGDTAAEVLYAGYAPGLVTGIVQINARLPEKVPAGKEVPIYLRVGSTISQNGVTLNIK